MKLSRRKLFGLFAAAPAVPVALAIIQEPELRVITGKEWVEMSQAERRKWELIGWPETNMDRAFYRRVSHAA